jgi:hypothetical protein
MSTPVQDRIASLDALAAEMSARGWTAQVTTTTSRLASLFVQDPRDRAVCGDVLATRDDATGDWWYWFGWAERIAPVTTPATAADAIVRGLHRSGDFARQG